MGPAGCAVVVALNIWREAIVCEGQLSFAVVFIEVKDQAGIGPFFLVGIPGHVAVGNQPHQPFAGINSVTVKLK